MEISSKRRSYIQGLMRPGLDKAGIPTDQQAAFINACLLQIMQMRKETYLPDKTFDIPRRIEHLSHVHRITLRQATDALVENPARLFKDGAPISPKEEPAPPAAQASIQSAPISPQETARLELDIAALILGASFQTNAENVQKSPEPSDAGTACTPLQRRYLHPSVS